MRPSRTGSRCSVGTKRKKSCDRRKSGRSPPSSGRRKPRTGSAKPRRRRNFNAKITSKFKGGSSRRWRGRRRRNTPPSSTPATRRTSPPKKMRHAQLRPTPEEVGQEREGHRQVQVRHSRLRPISEEVAEGKAVVDSREEEEKEACCGRIFACLLNVSTSRAFPSWKPSCATPVCCEPRNALLHNN